MQSIQVGLENRSYPILIGHDILDRLPDALGEVDFPNRIALVTNTTVGSLYADRVAAALGEYRSASIEVISIPDGEDYKSLETLEAVFSALIEKGFDRTSGMVALGGGVVGDLAGFAAACFLRGIPFAQIPTTLLAQVDSSVGGKTAVNHALGKNLIGAFYQPKLVLIDVAFLETLPERELRAGLAEVVKYGIIRDREFFSWLEQNAKDLLALHADSLIQAVLKSCQIKADIVEEDETETSTRAILNYGHTFGHAVELLSGYGTVRHGEAVAIGMHVAARISAAEGYCGPGDLERIAGLLRAIGLSVEIPPFPLDEYLAAMARDKKVRQGTLRYVFNRGIGDCLIGRLDSPKTVFSRLLHPSKQKGPEMSEQTSSLLGKIAAYTEILAGDPRSTVFVALSEAYRQMGLLDDALEIATQGTGNLPTYSPGFSALGRVLAQQGELMRAAEAFGRALELDSGHLPALKGLAKVCQRQGYPEQARTHLQKVLEISPDDATAKKLLAALGAESPPAPSQETTFAPAAGAAEDATSPAQPIPTETVADLYRKQGLLKEAAAIYREILNSDPQRETVRAKLIDIKKEIEEPGAAPASAPAEQVDEGADSEAAEFKPEVEFAEKVSEGEVAADGPGEGTPVSMLEQWLVSIEKRRAHVR